MRDLSAVDGELRVLSGVRRAMKSDGLHLRQDVVDRLLDERIEIEKKGNHGGHFRGI